MQLPTHLPSKRRLLATALVLYALRLFYKLGRWVYNVLTSVHQSKQVQHNCIPPTDYKHEFQKESAQLVQELYPQLSDLVANGNLVALQPRKMLIAVLQQQQQSHETLGSSTQQQEEYSFNLSDADVQEMVASPALRACMSAEVPELLLLVGTVHVSKQSADDVRRVLRAVHPAYVVLELCQARLRGLLLDPYSDPLHDLEPCPHKMAAAAEQQNKTLLEIVKSALSSRDHNIATAMLAGLQSQCADKMEVRLGSEFIAARQTLIEMLQEEQQRQQQQHPADQQAAGAAAAAHDADPDASLPTWLDQCVPGDRPLMDTVLGLWGSLGPRKRLQFIGDILWALVSGIDEETITSLGKEDMVELLLKEFSETYPEVMRPLLHDRNWVLATNTWHVAQRAAEAAAGGGGSSSSQGAGHVAGVVVAVVGKGHIPGMVYVVQWLVNMMAKTGGRPVFLQQDESSEQEHHQTGQH